MVVADSRFPRDGRFIDVVGTYDPKKNPPLIHVEQEKIHTWLKKGAHPTTTVKSLLKKAGVKPMEVETASLPGEDQKAKADSSV